MPNFPGNIDYLNYTWKTFDLENMTNCLKIRAIFQGFVKRFYFKLLEKASIDPGHDIPG